MHLILFAYNNLFITKTKSCSLTKVCCIKNSVVINAIKEAGGTMPEELPTPQKSLKQLEKENINGLLKK